MRFGDYFKCLILSYNLSLRQCDRQTLMGIKYHERPPPDEPAAPHDQDDVLVLQVLQLCSCRALLDGPLCGLRGRGLETIQERGQPKY